MMKHFRIFASILTILLLGAFSAHAIDDPATPDEKLRGKIIKLIGKPDVTDIEYHDRKAVVEFLITNKNELVVLSVDSKSDVLDSHIKQSMNYKKVNVVGLKKMSRYTIEMSFISRG